MVNTFTKVAEIGLPGGKNILKMYTFEIDTYSEGGLDIGAYIPELKSDDYIPMLALQGGFGHDAAGEAADGATFKLKSSILQLFNAEGKKFGTFTPLVLHMDFCFTLLLISKGYV